MKYPGPLSAARRYNGGGQGRRKSEPGGARDGLGRPTDENETVSTPTRVSNPAWNLLPTDIEGLDALAELALDMRWSWNHAADERVAAARP